MISQMNTPSIEGIMNYITAHYECIGIDDGHYVCFIYLISCKQQFSMRILQNGQHSLQIMERL